MLVDGLGLIGVVLTVIAYFLLVKEKVTPISLPYLLMNLIASSLILFSLAFTFNLSAATIQVFFIAISLIGLYKVWTQTKH